ncbi:MAG TPA: antibiotic biosynthesis monooxygenase family protein [Chloroflexota bacterium]|jgi:quinol monooxygenase YgiN|nr:antibiotic biosynthesis monooxygenase family protein [Chloroflexota bacterium]
MAEHASVIRVAHFPIAADKRQRLVTLLEGLSDQVRRMDGCFGAQVCTVRESSNEVAIVSRWANQAALDTMTQSGITSNDEVLGLLSGQPRTEHFEPL